MEEVEIAAGFLVVKTFERKYRDYLACLEQMQLLEKSRVYSDPIPLEQMTGKYRGVARDPIFSWYEEWHGTGVADEPLEEELDAHLFMTELEESGRAEGFFIFAENDARKLFAMIHPPVEREIVWAKRTDREVPPPAYTTVLGYEPIDFNGDFSSVITSVAFFRYRWNSDADDTRFKVLSSKLNKWGLFETPTDAQEYIDSFSLLELPEQDRPDHIAEVRVLT